VIAARRGLEVVFVPIVDHVLAVAVIIRKAIATMPAARAAVIVETIVVRVRRLTVRSWAVIRSAMIGVVRKLSVLLFVLLLTGMPAMIIRAASLIVLRERAGRDNSRCTEQGSNDLLCFHRK
jgi:hypothetical protein